MDAGKLFAQLMNHGESAPGGILTGTAVSDSVDGSVMVQMDGSVVAQPSEDETELVVSAEEFADGTYVLPSVPYAGTLTVSDSNGNELEQEDYDLDGSTLTIHALSSAPVDVSYETNVQQVLTNSDFDGDSYSLPSTTNLTVREDGQPVPYTLDGNFLTIDGIEHQAGIVEFSYIYDVSVVCSAGVNVLPNAPDEVAVFGRNSSGVDVVVTDYVLSGSTITLPDTYDAYTVDYPVSMVERWNVSDQYDEIPLEDSDDATDPETVTIGHDLQWEPSSVTSCTVDGVSTTYTLDVSNVVVDAPTITERYITLTYDSPVRMQVPASSFAVGPFTLPSVPVGSVITTMGGSVLANTVDDTQLTIDSLLTDSPTYTLTYTEQVEQDVVELPCTPYVAEGQFVEIAVVNGMPTVIGASGSGDVTMTLAVDASTAADAAQTAAEAAQEIAEATGQHVWEDTDGLHVTQAEKDAFLQTPTGRNILMNALGILIRDALQYRTVVHDEGLTVYDGQGNNASNVVANILRDLITLGYASESHAEIDYHSLQLIDKEGSAYFHVSDLRDHTGSADVSETFTGDGFSYSFYLKWPITSVTGVTVNGTAASYYVSGTNVVLSTTPAQNAEIVVDYRTDSDQIKAYTLGTRRNDVGIGPMSVAAGGEVGASGESSHAEGAGTVAAGDYSHSEGSATLANGIASHVEGRGSTTRGAASHAEGWDTHAEGGHAHSEGVSTNATGEASHAEGDGTTAGPGSAAHAEGNLTKAVGRSSHAQNTGTIASSDHQTTLGKYNVEDANDTYAVIIGNGTATNARSNALTVDWDGNVNAAGGATLSDSATVTRDTSGNTGFIATRSDTGASVGTIVGAGGTNHGLYSFSDNRWIIYSNGTDIRTGAPLAKASGGTGTTYGLLWQSLGSFTGTNSLTINLSNYSEVMVAAKFNHTNSGTTTRKLATATIAKQLLSTTAQELWLGGGKSSGSTANSGALRAIVSITTTKVTGVISSADSTDHTSGTTWYVYAR